MHYHLKCQNTPRMNMQTLLAILQQHSLRSAVLHYVPNVRDTSLNLDLFWGLRYPAAAFRILTRRA